jgi:hypothetical protein
MEETRIFTAIKGGYEIENAIVLIRNLFRNGCRIIQNAELIETKEVYQN